MHKVTDKLDIVTRHDHGFVSILGARRVRERHSHVRGADEQLRAVLYKVRYVERIGRTLFMKGV